MDFLAPLNVDFSSCDSNLMHFQSALGVDKLVHRVTGESLKVSEFPSAGYLV